MFLITTSEQCIYTPGVSVDADSEGEGRGDEGLRPSASRSQPP